MLAKHIINDMLLKNLYMCIFYEKNCINEDSMYKFILLCQVKLLSRAKSIQ